MAKHYQIMILTNDNIKSAVRLHFKYKKYCESIYGKIENWNTHYVTDMSYLFYDMKEFNEDISQWNVWNVRNMEYMFYDASCFNQYIGGWNVWNVRNMRYMFCNAHLFNQYIGNWNVMNVKNMEYMFYNAYKFNKYIGGWNVSNVRNMEYMFYNAHHFNYPVSNWNANSVNNIQSMFHNAKRFDQKIFGFGTLSLWNIKCIKKTDAFKNTKYEKIIVSRGYKTEDLFNETMAEKIYLHERKRGFLLFLVWMGYITFNGKYLSDNNHKVFSVFDISRIIMSYL